MQAEPAPLKKPQPPENNECCGGGSCCPCVWDRYYDALRAWQAQEGLTPMPKNSPPVDDDEPFYR